MEEVLEKIEKQPALFLNLQSVESPFVEFCDALDVDLTGSWADRFGMAISKWARKSSRTPIRTLSLFSGAGGLDIGFHDAGFQIVTSVELDKRFVATLQANSGENKYLGKAEVICDDIRNFSPPENFNVDFIIGGPPCQTFSAAGRRAAGVPGTTDKRGQLFEEYVRLLAFLKPKGFLFENVYGITGAEQGKSWQKICEAFSGTGYLISSRILDAADYGVPQHRERMFIVGTRDSEFKFPRPTHGPDSPNNVPYVNAAAALKDCAISYEEANAKVGGRFGHLLDQIPVGLNYSYFTEKMGHPSPIFAWRSKFSDFLYKSDPHCPVRTLKAQVGQYSGPFHWESRPFAVSELKRLQTFPDTYALVGGRQVAVHQIGNSVPPQLARILALNILNQVFEVELPVPLPLLSKSETLGFRKRKRQLTEIYNKKARHAINGIQTTVISELPSNNTYKAILSDDFSWNVSQNSKTALKVCFIVKKSSWEVHLSRPGKTEQSVFYISINPASGTRWAIPASVVVLRGSDLSRECFTGAWKAFEAELVRNNIKADLVQLYGYYQYSTALVNNMSFENILHAPKEWKILQKVVSGIGVRKIIPHEEMSSLWQCDIATVLKIATWLRHLGFEVRNRQTNPQIPENHILIPYSFPTFTPMSVQLRKSLEVRNA